MHTKSDETGSLRRYLHFAERGALLRQSALQLVERMQADHTIHIVPQDRETFLAGLRLFRARPDKGYSLTDCISMDCMAKRQLAEVLTNDDHFSQEGFVCLLREQ